MPRGEIRLTDLEPFRSVSVERVGAVVGRLPAHVMTQVNNALRLHLQL